MDRSPRLIRLLLVATVLGILARLALAAVSVGSYDAVLWQGFARDIHQYGLLQLYRTQPSFNHPPIAGEWASAAWSMAQPSGVRFALIFKLPMIAADAVACLLLWKIFARRNYRLLGAAIAAAYAWNLDALLISAYHCNTDSIYAVLALLSVYLVEECGLHVLGGLALGAAINIKLIPAILIIPMLGGYHDWRSLRRFIAGLVVAAIPFVPVVAFCTLGFARYVLSYTAPPAYWGVQHFLLEMVRLPRFSGWAQPLMDHYNDLGRYVVLLAVVWMTLVARRRNWDRYRSCAAAAAIFLILAPGFANQYTIFALPLLMAADPFLGVVYGTCAGAAALFSYWHSWPGGWPLSSIEGGPDNPAPGSLLGLLAWATLIAFLWKQRDRHILRLTNHRYFFLLLIAAAFAAREVLAWFSWGSADIGIMQYIARCIRTEGLFNLYRRDAGFNHTPLVGYWCVTADYLAGLTHLSFAFIFKQLLIVSDAFVCIVLCQLWKNRGAAIAAAFAWSLIAVLLSAHQGNFDPTYAMLCLLAAYLIHTRRAWFVGGLILGSAINVKLIPVLLVPVLAATCRSWRELSRFILGLAILAIPFMPVLVVAPVAFWRNVIHYQSTLDNWGVNLFLREAARRPRFSAVAQSLAEGYFNAGRFILIGAIALVAIRARRLQLNPLQASAVAAAVFMILTPGFGLQYLAFALPLLFAVSPTHAIAYGVTAGLMAFFNYWLNWPGGIPFDTTGIATTPRAPGPQFGLLAWAVLISFVWSVLRRRLNDDAPGLLTISSSAARS